MKFATLLSVFVVAALASGCGSDDTGKESNSKGDGGKKAATSSASEAVSVEDLSSCLSDAGAEVGADDADKEYVSPDNGSTSFAFGDSEGNAYLFSDEDGAKSAESSVKEYLEQFDADPDLAERFGTVVVEWGDEPAAEAEDSVKTCAG